jgi:hypothetical protein
MKRTSAFVALALLCGPGLAAQDNVSARLAGRVPPALAAAVSALVDSARTRGLPGAPLVDKALEGAVKGAPPDRILTAVRTVLDQLDASATAQRTAASPTPGDDAVEAGAFALAAGLTPSDIGVIARSADQTHPAAVALQVAGALAALGVPRTETVGLVRASIQSGRPVGDLVSLPGQVQAAIARGAMPAAAAAGLERAAAAHQAPPHAQVKGKDNPHKP